MTSHARQVAFRVMEKAEEAGIWAKLLVHRRGADIDFVGVYAVLANRDGESSINVEQVEVPFEFTGDVEADAEAVMSHTLRG